MREKLKAESYADHATLLRMMSDEDRVFAEYYKDLKVFARLRNLLIHNPYGKNAEPIFVPHEYVLKRYKSIVKKVLNPQRAFSICVRREFIYTAKLSDNALDVMSVMNNKTYTHVPIMDNDKMIGIFSENTLLSYVSHHKDSLIMKDMKVEEFKRFIPLNSHPSEYFEFVSRDVLVVDVEDVFKKGLRAHKRIAVVFITQDGRPDQKMLGMMTAWDLVGRSTQPA